MVKLGTISILDVRFAQEVIMRAYDLLCACEEADAMLLTDEIKDAAVEFRRVAEEHR
jgi:hypothetical protein